MRELQKRDYGCLVESDVNYEVDRVEMAKWRNITAWLKGEFDGAYLFPFLAVSPTYSFRSIFAKLAASNLNKVT